ncbi:MAG: hypothetical protein JO248_07995 [Acidimicrobiia bacterium]|nr:hypothetical protein [Acidimicrobiia bacterium]
MFAEGQASGEFAEIDPVDATTAIMGAVSMVAMRHTVHGDFDPVAVGDALIPRLLDGVRSEQRRPSPATRQARRGARTTR